MDLGLEPKFPNQATVGAYLNAVRAVRGQGKDPVVLPLAAALGPVQVIVLADRADEVQRQ